MNNRKAAFLALYFLAPVKSFSSPSSSSHRTLHLTASAQRKQHINTIMGSTASKDDASGVGKVWDRFAEGYSKQPIADEEAYQKKLEMTREYLRPHMNMLEIGCGTGGTSLLHAPRVRQVLATDVSTKMIEIAQQKATEAKVDNVEFRRASTDELSSQVPNASQDVVLAMSILHLVHPRPVVLANIHKWLKPGGIFVSSTPCIADMGFGMRALANAITPIGSYLGLLPRVYAFSKQEHVASLEEAGFRIEKEWQPKESGAVFIIASKKEE